jgi:hypothetical protein
MLRRVCLAAIAACALSLGAAHADSEKPKEFRVGLLGGENTQDGLARYGKFQQLLEQKLGIPVKLFPATQPTGSGISFHLLHKECGTRLAAPTVQVAPRHLRLRVVPPEQLANFRDESHRRGTNSFQLWNKDWPCPQRASPFF